MSDTSNFIIYSDPYSKPTFTSHTNHHTPTPEHMESKLVLSSKDLATVDLQYMYFLQCI